MTSTRHGRRRTRPPRCVPRSKRRPSPERSTKLKALVTGAAGFVGRHLMRHLLAQGYVVTGLDRPGHRALEEEFNVVGWRVMDLTDSQAVAAALADEAPDAIYHLAGQPAVPLSWEDPVGTFRSNVEPILHMCRSIIALGLVEKTTVLVVGSNEVYGVGRAEGKAMAEDTPLEPVNPYAASKVAQDNIAAIYASGHGLKCVRVRPFTHIGPGQTPDFVTSAFARQVAAIEAGQQPPVIHVGNLASNRDFTDVRDMVRAYELAATMGRPGDVFNIGSGHAFPIQGVLDTYLRLSTAHITVEIDPARFRPNDVRTAICDGRRFRERTGWSPAVPIEQTLADILNYWRRQEGIA